MELKASKELEEICANRKTIVSYKVFNDFPKEGVEFLDLSPSLLNREVYSYLMEDLGVLIFNLFDIPYEHPDENLLIMSPEARGFVWGSAVAFALEAGIITMRKEGKLPDGIGVEYEKEYGKDKLFIPRMQNLKDPDDNFYKGKNILFVDDVYATGGTYRAAKELCEKVGANFLGGIVVATVLDNWKNESGLYSMYNAE